MNPNDDVAIGRAVYAKVAWRTLPLLGLGYLFAYMDRVNIGFAAAQMNADLGFSAAVYSFGGGLFFLSYALLEVPSNLMFKRFGARVWISRIMITWGLLAAAMMFVRTEWQFYTLRLLLGAAEAGFFPAVVVYLSRWYPMATRSRALSTFYVAFPLASVVMGGLAGVLLGLDGVLGLRGWHWLLVIEGLPAVLIGLAILAWLPERPEAATWLSETERAWLNDKLAHDPATEHRETLGDIGRILSHPLVLILGLANALFLGTGYAFTLTAPQVLSLRTGLPLSMIGQLTALGGLLGAAAMLINGRWADRTGRHYVHVVIPLLIQVVGYSLVAFAPKGLGPIPGYLLTVIGSCGFNAVFFVLVSKLLPQRDLLVGAAALNMVGQFGSFVLPTLYGVAQTRAGHLDGALWLAPIPYLLAASIILSLAIRSRRLAAPVPA
jgi:ACS family tartrate transporter-like MFS transporter